MLIIIRGLPGSGKSNAGHRLAAALECGFVEPDHFCNRDGTYQYDPVSYKKAETAAMGVVWLYGVLQNGADLVYADVLPTMDNIRRVSDNYGEKPLLIVTLTVSEEYSKVFNVHKVRDEDLRRMVETWEEPTDLQDAAELMVWNPMQGDVVGPLLSRVRDLQNGKKGAERGDGPP